MTLFLLFYSYPVIKGYVYSSFLKPYNPAKVPSEHLLYAGTTLDTKNTLMTQIPILRERHTQ